MKIPIVLANGANAELIVELKMTTQQKQYAMNVLGLGDEEIKNAMGQEFNAFATLLGADDSQMP